MALGTSQNAVDDFAKALEIQPDAGSLWEARGMGHLRLGCWQEAVADFSKALELKDAGALFPVGRALPLLSPPAQQRLFARSDDTIALYPHTVPVFASRAAAYVHLRQWNKAAADYDKLLELQPTDGMVWFENAYLRLKRGDIKGYRQLCGRMLEQFGQSKQMYDIAMLAHTWVLALQAPGDAARVPQLAERRLSLTTHHPTHSVWSMHVLGLAYYRTGMNDKAVECLTKAVKDHPDWQHNVLNWLVLALAHHRLKHHDEAGQWLNKAGRAIEEINRSRPEKGGGFAPPAWAWRDWLGVQMLRDEADELLGTKRQKK
jgi:tetratricopeptide (TPR) repeat protein